MGTYATITTTFVAATKAKASEVNQNFTDIINALTDGTITLESAAFRAATGSASEPGFSFIGDTDTGFNFHTIGAFNLLIGGSVKARFDANGVFIGNFVTSPASLLHVGGTTATARIQSETTTSNAELLFSNGSTATGMMGVDASNAVFAIVGGTSTLSNPNKFFASPNNRFGVGSVGQGTELFTVFDQNTLNSGLLIEAQTNGLAYLRYQSVSNVLYNFMDTSGAWRVGTTLSSGNGFGIDSNGNPFVVGTSSSIDFTSGSGNGVRAYLGITTPTGFLHLFANTTSASILRLTSSHKSAVATSTIFALNTNVGSEGDTELLLRGHLLANATFNMYRSTVTAMCSINLDTTTSLFLDSNTTNLVLTMSGAFLVKGGSVAINATTPGARLHIREDGAGITATTTHLLKLQVATTDDLTGVGIMFGVQGGATTQYDVAEINAVLSGPGDTDLLFHTSSDSGSTRPEQMRITHNGNVGIGITAPATKLHINGGLQVSTSDTTGNVFSNTFTPTAGTGTNITTTSISPYSIAYMVLGKTLIFGGRVDVQAVGAGATDFTLSLPGSYQTTSTAGWVGGAGTLSDKSSVQIDGDGSTTVRLYYTAPDGANRSMSFQVICQIA